MSTKKSLGIWMDHSDAHIMEYDEAMTTEVIVSDFTHEEKEKTLNKSESSMHNKEEQQQSEYYKKLGSIIEKYEDVVLFGPTDAKLELLNVLKADHHFENIKIATMPADKMTENQEHAFVKDYFSKKRL